MKKTGTILAVIIFVFTFIFTACTIGNTSKNSENNTITDNHNTKAITDNADAGLKIADFFPLEKDVYMKYKGTGNEYAEYQTFVEFIKDNIVQIRNINPGTSLAIVYEIKEGELRKNFFKGEVYYRYDYTDTKDADEIEVLIKEPIRKGTSWTLGDGTKRSITEVNKDIATPIGNYTALEITSEYKDSVTTDYYVKDLGHVKKVFKSKDSDFTITSELEKVEKGVPYKERIRFFYPDFNKDKLAYIDKEIDLLTNQDIKAIFEKELKNIPVNSELTKTISDNTKVLNISIDSSSKDNNDIVIVDFSSQLVTEMNAGTSLESMILGSITNTFGSYYQTQNVGITLEKKPFESGHIYLELDEFWKVNTDKSYEYK